MKNLVFKIGNTLQVVRKGTTSNGKLIKQNDLLKNEKIVQTYTFSRTQFEQVILGECKGMEHFFNSADTNCLDCPFNSYGKCYTHERNQFMGFIAMLKSIAKEYKNFDSLPQWDEETMLPIALKMADKTFCRFGTYGEPSLHDFKMIDKMCNVAKSWTGYTHQWHRNKLEKYFMASVHSKFETLAAQDMGYRSFAAIPKGETIAGLVLCPASAEGGFKSTCSECGLCSGTSGTKAKKSVYINDHGPKARKEAKANAI